MNQWSSLFIFWEAVGGGGIGKKFKQGARGAMGKKFKQVFSTNQFLCLTFKKNSCTSYCSPKNHAHPKGEQKMCNNNIMTILLCSRVWITLWPSRIGYTFYNVVETNFLPTKIGKLKPFSTVYTNESHSRLLRHVYIRDMH